MAPAVVDFYVQPLISPSSPARLWLVCSGTTAHCVATHETLAEALAHAVEMAAYRSRPGHAVRVHLRETQSQDWKTMWPPCAEAPRFP